MKIKGRTNYDGNIFETVLRNRNVENIDLFLNPILENNLDIRLKERMKRGIDLLLKHIKKGSLIIAIVDSDVDGMTSTAILFKYLKKTFPNINLVYIFHESKAHGFTEEIIKKIDSMQPQLVFCCDAGTNDKVNIEKLKLKNTDVIVIDHHEIDTPSDDCVLINNQLNGCPNKKLTGAGMTLKFCEEIDKWLGLNNSEELWELAMLGMIGDSADLINNEVRYICDTAKSNVRQSFLTRVINEKKNNINDLSFIDFSFGIIPLINAVCRIGTLEEKDIVFRALADIDTDFMITLSKRKLNKDTRKYEMRDIDFDLYAYAIDICTTVKARQDKFVENFIKKNEIDNSGDVIVVISEEDLQGLTGLIAGKIANEYSKPTLVMQNNTETFNGSGRGYEKVLPSLKDWCTETGLFYLAQGHANAHGVGINKENIDKLLTLARSIEGVQGITHDVDFIYEGTMPLEDIEIIDRNRRHFGGGNVKEAQFGIINMSVPKENIQLKGASTLKIYNEGIYFVKYKSSKEEYESIISNFASHIKFDVVCRVEISIYNGKKYHQALISAFEFEPEENIEIYF